LRSIGREPSRIAERPCQMFAACLCRKICVREAEVWSWPELWIP
jgi:hypothetical protein